MKTLTIGGDELPDYGVEVRSGDAVVGTLTSPAESPRFGRIALAILDTDHAAEGTELEVELAVGTAPATVAPLAIYDPEKKRPRM
jgi:glycine cleavage system aminomethyltransferase T